MFRKDADFEAFERVIVEAHHWQPIRILSYCVLSNHWHFVVWPEKDGQVTDFFRRLGTRTQYGGAFRTGPRVMDTSIKGVSRVFPFRATITSCRSCAT